MTQEPGKTFSVELTIEDLMLIEDALDAAASILNGAQDEPIGHFLDFEAINSQKKRSISLRSMIIDKRWDAQRERHE